MDPQERVITRAKRVTVLEQDKVLASKQDILRVPLKPLTRVANRKVVRKTAALQVTCFSQLQGI